MKFGTKMTASLYGDWQYYYMYPSFRPPTLITRDYVTLKKLLKKGSAPDGSFTEDDEANFVRKMESELDKVFI
jgi:SPX domain protein involved in polyphosphate accumulation